MSGFLLDTNVVSELARPRPHANVAAWIESLDENLLHLSVLTLGEVRKGIALLKDPARAVQLEAWLNSDLKIRFAGRILPVDDAVADRWGYLVAKALPKVLLPVIDGLLAATALEHNLTLVTRNTAHFAAMDVLIFNPWIS